MTSTAKVAVVGVLCFVLGLLAGVLFADHSHRDQPSTEDNIIFPTKVYTDTGDFVSITGRLAGSGLANKNNVETITCYHQFNECQLQNVDQIGPNQISSLYPAISLPIRRWDDRVITASDKGSPDSGACFNNTVNIDRKRELLLLVQEPTNQSSLACQHVDANIYKFTIERSLWEEKAFPKP